MNTGHQTIAAVETLHSCYVSSTAHIFSDCAITKYLSRATAFTVNNIDSRRRPGNYCAARDTLCRCRRWHSPRLRVVRNIDFVGGVIIAIKICHDTTSISPYSIRYDISCHRYMHIMYEEIGKQGRSNFAQAHMLRHWITVGRNSCIRVT